MQAVLRHQPADSDGCPPGRRDAEKLIQHATPDESTDTDAQWEPLLPHVIALAETTPPHSPASTDTAGVYHAAARYLDRIGRDAHTISLRTAALALREQVLGDTHPQTLASRNDLACAYQAAGDLGRAISLHEATLALRERVLGDAHPDTLASRNNLAYAIASAGDLPRAISMYEATLAQCEQALGDAQPETVATRSDLACAYQAAGDLERAISLHEATLALRERVLGATHPQTLASRHNLAHARRAAQAAQRRSTAPSSSTGDPRQSSATD